MVGCCALGTCRSSATLGAEGSGPADGLDRREASLAEVKQGPRKHILDPAARGCPGFVHCAGYAVLRDAGQIGLRHAYDWFPGGTPLHAGRLREGRETPPVRQARVKDCGRRGGRRDHERTVARRGLVGGSAGSVRAPVGLRRGPRGQRLERDRCQESPHVNPARSETARAWASRRACSWAPAGVAEPLGGAARDATRRGRRRVWPPHR